MNSLKQVTTFKGEIFEPVQIVQTRQDGFGAGVSLYVNESRDKIIVANANGDVVKSISVSALDGSLLIGSA